MKKILLYVLCLVLIAVSFVGCGNKTEGETGEQQTRGQQTVADVSEEESQASTEDESSEEEESSEESESSNPVVIIPEVPAWKTAYLKFIEEQKDEYVRYALVYVDSDSIPELYLSGCCEAAGDIVCSYKNGRLIYEHLNRIGGGSYIHKGGLVFNFNGNMGHYYANVYKLTNGGFTNIFTGLQQERIIELGEDEYDIEYDFYVGNNLVTEEEFYEAINAVFNMNASRDFYSQIVSYATIKQQINNA